MFFSHTVIAVQLVHIIQRNLGSMVASWALSTPMILNSHGHIIVCDQPQHSIAITPLAPEFIIHFALSHCSHKDLHVALVSVCEEALWHLAWCTFTACTSSLKGGKLGYKGGQFGLRLTSSAWKKISKCLPEIIMPLPPLSDDTGSMW